MKKELAIRIASQDENVKNTSDLMKKANEIYQLNSQDNMLPFAQVDISYATFIDYVKENATQREKDLIIVSEFLQKVWKTLHISVQTLHEDISPSDEKDIKNLYSSLKNLGLTNLLTDGLNKKTLKIVDKICDDENKEIKPKRKFK